MLSTLSQDSNKKESLTRSFGVKSEICLPWFFFLYTIYCLFGKLEWTVRRSSLAPHGDIQGEEKEIIDIREDIIEMDCEVGNAL